MICLGVASPVQSSDSFARTNPMRALQPTSFSAASLSRGAASYGYTAYGAPNAALTKRAAGIPESLNPYRYTGKRWDPGSGTLDMGARRFNPTTTRFLQQDQYLGALDDLSLSLDPLTQNRYALAAGNPVGYVEVDGHSVACAQVAIFYASCTWTGEGKTLTSTTFGLTAEPVTRTKQNVGWAANPKNFGAAGIGAATGADASPSPSDNSKPATGSSGGGGGGGGWGSCGAFTEGGVGGAVGGVGVGGLGPGSPGRGAG